MCQHIPLYSNSAMFSTVYFVLVTSFHFQCQDGEARVRLPILSPQRLVSTRTSSCWDWARTPDWAEKHTPLPSLTIRPAVLSPFIRLPTAFRTGWLDNVTERKAPRLS